MARFMIIAGLALAALGVLLYLFGKIPGMGKLPGDILIKKENVTFYFPLVSCILLSVLITLIMNFFRK